MLDKLRTFLTGLLYENDSPSLTRFLFAASFLFCILLTVDAIHFNPEYMDKIFTLVQQIMVFVLGAKTTDKIIAMASDTYSKIKGGGQNNA